MAIMRILIDGHQFESKLRDDWTRDRIETHARMMATSKLDGLSVELVDGSFLSLAQESLRRAVFVFLPGKE